MGLEIIAVFSDEPASNPEQGIHARLLLRYPGWQSSEFSLEVDLAIPGHGITAIFGPSGSGKTTLLRCVAGLEQADRGRLSVNGETWQSDTIFVPTHKRPLGYVFQESSLFPHLSAQGNLTYAIKRSGARDSTELYERVITTLGIESLLQRYPSQLSGGERQRVAIARALLIRPRVLLMDEPLASLDTARKQEILSYLERLKSGFEMPVLYVSHSMDEVARLADHVVVLEQGRVITQGGLGEVFSRIDLPLHIGEDASVVLQGQVVERDVQWHLAKVACSGGNLWVRDAGDAVGEWIRVRILARDVSLTLAACEDSSILNRLPVEIAEIRPDQDKALCLVRLKAGGDYLIARLTRRSAHYLKLEPGQRLWAQVKSVAIVR